MRWALPFIAGVITLGLSLVGAPPVSGQGVRPMRQEAMPLACGLAPPAASGLAAMRQAAAGARWEPALLWSGLALGTPDNPLTAAWRGFVDAGKRRPAPLAGRSC